MLEAPALLVAGLHETPARRLQLGDARVHLGLKLRVRSRQPRGRTDCLDKLRVVEHGRVVNERRHRLAVALDPRDAAGAIQDGERERTPRGFDVGRDLGRASSRPRGRIAQATRERIANRPGPRLADLDYEVGHDRGIP